MKIGTNSIWTCPSRLDFPWFQYPVWNIGYQYFGGINP